MSYQRNPPWVDRILTAHWDGLKAVLGAKWMPVATPDRSDGMGKLVEASFGERLLTAHWDVRKAVLGAKWMPVATPRSRPGKRSFKEYGCGHFGCVMPTSDDGVVIKITSDASEAMFVAAAMSLGKWPEGIVRYHKLVELPVTYRRRRVFAMAREEAHDIGFLLNPFQEQDSYKRRAMNEMVKNLESFKRLALFVNRYVSKAKDPAKAIAEILKHEDHAWEYTRQDRVQRHTGGMMAAVSKQQCEDVAEEMANTYLSDLVGSALLEYLQAGLLLADVHANNVGKVDRVDEYNGSTITQVVITDPGLMAPLDKRWLSVPVPSL